MSEHDELMSKFIELKHLLIAYDDEYGPRHALKCLDLLYQAMILANDFPKEDL